MGLLAGYAQEGPQLFPDGMTTDQADSQVCAETVREKMLLCLDKEIPHGTAVEVTRFSERESGIIDSLTLLKRSDRKTEAGSALLSS